MKNLIQLVLILLLFTCIDFKLIAQKYYGNEWIKTDKKYLKLKVAEDGIYRVTYEEMVTHGFIQGSTDGSNFQLINFGKEQALFVIDASQSVPHFKIDVEKLKADFVFFTGHKIMADSGI